MARPILEQPGQGKWLVAAVIVALLAGFSIWRLLQPTPTLSPTAEQPTHTAFEPPPAPPPPVEALETPPVPEPTPLVEASPEANQPPPAPLPGLDDSDPTLKGDLRALPGNVQQLVTDEYLVRKSVRAIAAMANGELVNQYRPLQNPRGNFSATRDGEAYRLSEENFKRYTPYVEAALAVGPDRLLSLYQRYYPLLDEAYRELGVEGTDFDAALVAAIDQMLSVSGDVDTTLVRPTVMYKFQDPAVEGLPAVQKLMLRIGPDNRERLRPLLQSLRQRVTQG